MLRELKELENIAKKQMKNTQLHNKPTQQKFPRWCHCYHTCSWTRWS